MSCTASPANTASSASKGAMWGATVDEREIDSDIVSSTHGLSGSGAGTRGLLGITLDAERGRVRGGGGGVGRDASIVAGVSLVHFGHSQHGAARAELRDADGSARVQRLVLKVPAEVQGLVALRNVTHYLYALAEKHGLVELERRYERRDCEPRKRPQ